MNVWLRLVLALAVWSAAAAIGWWSQRSADETPAAVAAPAGPTLPPLPARGGRDDGAARRIIEADPFVLRLLPPPQAGAPAPGSEQTVVWRISALVVRGTERYAVLVSDKDTSLRVAQGERLPDGDRIKSIEPQRIEIQSPRGRVRTVYLTEP